ncbi:cytochrome b-245 chaperone 1 homolog isoform X2 [Polypterus senegalus]|nr:cytochrome b-245 chaperone 1 homolog isoform X2 [Polypterus senegalus]XP_039595665.1 cytochrome b-245 chaperone 1 homolog isoform X2 [Polypterus senegalus]
MGYMIVEAHTATLLHLKRSPGYRSWSLLVGISSVGLAAAYYSSDSWMWKLFYVTGCLFVAIQNVEEWEEAIFNKSEGSVILKSFNLYTKILTLWRKGHEQVVAQLKHLRAVSVEEEKVRYLGKGYLVVLRFATGFSHPLTQSATLSGRSDAEAVAELLKRFLDLDERVGCEDDEVSSTDSDEVSFEEH